MICYCCKMPNNRVAAFKSAIIYVKCAACGSIYTTNDIYPVTETENDCSDKRNTLPLNQERIRRLEVSLGRKISTALDFGCGHGHLVSLMRANKIEAEGIDRGTDLQWPDLDDKSFEVITLIEVIEHLEEPEAVLRMLTSALKPSGIMMIETTFADSIKDPSTSTYVDPKIGHVNIISTDGLKMCLPSDLEYSHMINPHVMILRKKPEVV